MRFSGRTPAARGLLVVVVLVALAAPAAGKRDSANHHCANEQPVAASERIVIARELTEASDIYVTCWRKTNKHRVVAKFPAEDRQDVAFRMKGEWVVWRYRTERDRMGSINARTGRRGPTVSVPVQSWPLRLDGAGGPAAQDVGDSGALFVFIASNGYYAWPVTGDLPDAEGAGHATAMYQSAGNGDDERIDVGDGLNALRKIRIHGATLRWVNNGTARHARLGPRTAKNRARVEG